MFIRKKVEKIAPISKDLPAIDTDLFEVLRKLRREIAQQANVPPFIIFSDATLCQMCINYPTSEDEMLKISGVGKVKLDNYGGQFITAISNFLKSQK